MAKLSLRPPLSAEDCAFLDRSAAAQAAFATRWLVDLPADLCPAFCSTPPDA
ncbi:hypothetical protein SAMN04488238_10240 [Roseicitreum antarcticum]|uniref:Uncharacterized protein n=1 Tax=Roseicitreum antarcticum TaxID=564137 RepID=A0A1H2TFJ1_9RHOB|nr:hypothetical protein SAMN04488238_10240 [Roseicitreum antarcticum]